MHSNRSHLLVNLFITDVQTDKQTDGQTDGIDKLALILKVNSKEK
jgi:hypothetical protein